MLGLVVATAVAAVVEGILRLLGAEGRVSGGFFVAVAALTPVLALGLLLQLVTVLAGRAGRLVRELDRFDEEMSAEPTELDEEAHESRRSLWYSAGLFIEVLVPFEAGLALQFLVTEVVAIYCVVAGVDARLLALALGVEVLALLVHLLFFSAMLAGLTKGRRAAAA